MVRDCPCLHVVFSLCCFSLHAQDDLTHRQTVVKVFCKSNQVSLGSPWKREVGSENSGSGVWLGDNRILTNEHLVRYPTQISVQPYESADRIPADVVFVSPEMDIAIIEMDGRLPFPDLEPPEFAEQLPKLRSTVRVYGFPAGGQSLSVTEGIVSRIEYRPYSLGEAGLRIQVDAAINPGNSGGPAYVDDKIVGLAFQRRSRSDNIGYLIPSEEVLRLLAHSNEEVAGRKPVLPVHVQPLVNRQLREKLSLPEETTGVWVRELFETADGYPVHVGDILTHIGEHAIDNSGQTRISEDLLVDFQYLVPRLAGDGKVVIRLIRDSDELEVEVPVQPRTPRLITPLKGKYPEYFVYGPLVFVPAYADYLQSFEAALLTSNARARLTGFASMKALGVRESPLLTRRMDPPAFDQEELVLVANWLPHRITIGYQSPRAQLVEAVNGVKIRNLKHLVETLRDLKDDYVEFEFIDNQVETLVFDREQLLKASDDILLNNGVPRQGSRSLLDVWRAH